MPKDVAVVSELPPNWAVWVDAVVTGTDPVEAARSVGWREPKTTAGILLRHPTVRKALVTAAQVKLEWRGTQLALEVVEEIMTDRDPKAKAVRAKMAIALLDRIKPTADQKPGTEKPIGEMTVDELRQYVAEQRGSAPRPPQMRDVTPGRGDPSDITP